MPRPRKCRRVCFLPDNLEFTPAIPNPAGGPVFLTVDEFETIRLIDKEGLSQEECGAMMEVARTTVQQIYTTAREKLAVALVDGRPLKIEGGQYRLCPGGDGPGSCGGNAGCHMRRCGRENPCTEHEDESK